MSVDRFSSLPPECLLCIFSYLDIPEIRILTHVAFSIRILASDPILHRHRILIVAPSRVSHALFGTSPPRSTVPQLVQRNILKGMGLERRWRLGHYLYSHHAVKQYDSSVRLQKEHVSNVIRVHLRRREPMTEAALLAALHKLGILPDIESSSPRISRTILPAMHDLKWSIQRDKLSKAVKSKSGGGLATWLEGRGRSLVSDGERVRLALCGDVRKLVRFWEGLGLRQ